MESMVNYNSVWEIERRDYMSTANIQYYDWGQVEWIYEPDSINSFNVMNIGIYTIHPGKGQNKHIHYGDEQLLYVLSGKGKQLIGDTISLKEAGSIFHIEAGSIHETTNIGDEPLIELVISIPANYENNMFIKNKINVLNNNKRKYSTSIEINDEMKNIYDGFANSLKIPISILDREGNVIIAGKAFPPICEIKCNIDKSIYNCCMYAKQEKYDQSKYSDLAMFICPYGLSVIVMSIVCNGEVIGITKGGHIRTSLNNINNDDNIFFMDNKIPEIMMPDTISESTQFFSKASLKAVLQQLEKLNKYILNYYIFKNTEVELDKKEGIIQDISKHEIILEKSLKSTQEKVLDFRINNHFLFNTLNAIASLAVKENAIKTYESIVNLSKMFRYTSKTHSNFVKLKDEIDYLTIFINLQKLRFGDKLKVISDISAEIENVVIPFNCLQPILENCFIHGFRNKKNRMTIEIHGKRDKGYAVIGICDNGIGMIEKDVEALNRRIHQSIKNEVLSGLMMIYTKFQLIYNENFSFEISSLPNKGTSVLISLPI